MISNQYERWGIEPFCRQIGLKLADKEKFDPNDFEFYRNRYGDAREFREGDRKVAKYIERGNPHYYTISNGDWLDATRRKELEEHQTIIREEVAKQRIQVLAEHQRRREAAEKARLVEVARQAELKKQEDLRAQQELLKQEELLRQKLKKEEDKKKRVAEAAEKRELAREEERKKKAAEETARVKAEAEQKAKELQEQALRKEIQDLERQLRADGVPESVIGHARGDHGGEDEEHRGLVGAPGYVGKGGGVAGSRRTTAPKVVGAVGTSVSSSQFVGTPGLVVSQSTAVGQSTPVGGAAAHYSPRGPNPLGQNVVRLAVGPTGPAGTIPAAARVRAGVALTREEIIAKAKANAAAEVNAKIKARQETAEKNTANNTNNLVGGNTATNKAKNAGNISGAGRGNISGPHSSTIGRNVVGGAHGGGGAVAGRGQQPPAHQSSVRPPQQRSSGPTGVVAAQQQSRARSRSPPGAGTTTRAAAPRARAELGSPRSSVGDSRVKKSSLLGSVGIAQQAASIQQDYLPRATTLNKGTEEQRRSLEHTRTNNQAKQALNPYGNVNPPAQGTTGKSKLPARSNAPGTSRLSSPRGVAPVRKMSPVQMISNLYFAKNFRGDKELDIP